ncbi:MAG: polysaccharide biosynthesis/export family protein, partial [Bacteroidota bacterium]
AVILSSCGSTEKMTYLQDIAETGMDSTFKKNKPGYEIQPGDLLYIRVITSEEEVNKIFDPMMGGGGGNQQSVRPESMYYNGYSVSDSGYIEMPILDSIYVKDMSIEAAKSRISEKADKYLKEAQVIAKLANFRFTVMGEVNAPGVKEVLDNQVNVMEALAYAGDITYNGNRQEVLVIRPTGDGSKTYRIDVTNENLIGLEEYYVQPNDIIYVKPLRSTLFRERSSDYMFILSAVSSVLSSTAIILNLLNN